MSQKLKGTFNVTHFVADWFEDDARLRPAVYFGVPTVVGAASFVFDWQVADFGSAATAATFMFGFLINLLFSSYRWSEEAIREAEQDADEAQRLGVGSGGAKDRLERRLNALERLTASVGWGALVSLGLAAALFIANTAQPDQQADADLTLPTAVVAAVATHLALIMLAAINRLMIVTRHSVREGKRKAGITG